MVSTREFAISSRKAQMMHTAKEQCPIAGLHNQSGLSEDAFDRAECFSNQRIEIVLWDFHSPVNIGLILRIAEAFDVSTSLADFRDLTSDPAKATVINDFSCGAFGRRPPGLLVKNVNLKDVYAKRRVVATTIDPHATALESFVFLPGDVILFGNEYDGLPDDIMKNSDALLHIRLPARHMPKVRSQSPIDASRLSTVAREGQPSLNVAVSVGIVCYRAYESWLTSNDK